VQEDSSWVIMKRISLFILFSFFLHLMALLAVPDFLKPTKVTLIPVTMIKAADLYLEPMRKRTMGAKEMGLWEDTPVQSIRDEVVLRKLSEMGLSEDLNPPLPRISLFPAEKIDEQEKMRILKTSRFYHELKEMVQLQERRGKVYEPPSPKLEDIKGTSPPLPQDTEAKRIIAAVKEIKREGRRVVRPVPQPETLKLGIKGPAASRKVLYVPPPAKVKVTVETDVLLKFWVLPNGTVGKVIPLVKGDAQVELAAINHIKRYRFNPLPKDVPQVEMWGVISVRSVLR